MDEPNSYEEQRRRRVDENKRKMEELGLRGLYAAVREAVVAEPMPNKKLRPRNPRPSSESPIWRSARITGLGKQPDYHIGRANRSKRAILRKSVQVFTTYKERVYVITKAEDLTKQLGHHHTFVKPLNLNYATGRRGLPIQRHFRKSRYLPSCNETIILVDEEEDEFDVSYLARHGAFSVTDWRPFASDHK